VTLRHSGFGLVQPQTAMTADRVLAHLPAIAAELDALTGRLGRDPGRLELRLTMAEPANDRSWPVAFSKTQRDDGTMCLVILVQVLSREYARPSLDGMAIAWPPHAMVSRVVRPTSSMAAWMGAAPAGRRGRFRSQRKAEAYLRLPVRQQWGSKVGAEADR
jgi:hypothetical protein